jgi:hypothetical protein
VVSIVDFIHISYRQNRVSSCLFADRIANLSIAEYKKQCPVELQDSYKQTVLATFSIHRKIQRVPRNIDTPTLDADDIKIDPNASDNEKGDSTLEVVSIGVGTKILTKRKVIDELRCSKATGTLLVAPLLLLCYHHLHYRSDVFLYY